MPLAILDIQHTGRASRPGDMGAGADLDHDGQVEPDEREVAIVRAYVDVARARLEGMGIEVLVLDQGEYSERHARAAAAAEARPRRDRAAYVACHLNAGQGDYGLVLYDHRSTGGRRLAESVAWELGAQLRPPLRRVVTSWTGAPTQSPPYPRAWACLRGIYDGPAELVGVLVEPAFVDRPDHAPLTTGDGPRRIGEALALGVSAWLAGRAA